MAVSVWVGDKPEHMHERRAVILLAQRLQRLDGMHALLANFNVNGRTLDLVVIKRDAIFVIETKHCDGKIFGDTNGPWFVENANGERKRLNPGRRNPYNQALAYYYSLVNFLNDQRDAFLAPHKAKQTTFRSCRRVIAIAPTLQPGSEVTADWRVRVMGLDELPFYILAERSDEFELEDAEITAIPGLLHCTPWQEINALLDENAVPAQPAVSAPAVEVSAMPEPIAALPIEPVPTIVQALNVQPEPEQALATDSALVKPARKGLAWLPRTHTGKAIAAVTSLVITLLLAVWLQTLPIYPSTAESGQPSEEPMINATLGPAGGVFGRNLGRANDCVWYPLKAIGKRWNAVDQRWQLLTANDASSRFAPDILVTLEQIDTCENRIQISWTIVNYGDREIVFLRDAGNIMVRDSYGTVYPVAAGLSAPSPIVIEPNSVRRASITIEQPLHARAESLIVQVRRLPFDEATWIVPLKADS